MLLCHVKVVTWNESDTGRLACFEKCTLQRFHLYASEAVGRSSVQPVCCKDIGYLRTVYTP